MWKTILVPHDFSESADRAARVAAEEAKLHGGRLVLVHVVELPLNVVPEKVIAGDDGTQVSVRDFALASAQARLRELARQLGVAADAAVVEFGYPEDVIVRLADETRADVIVMASHGRGALAKLFVGSITDRVVRASRVPVLVIPPPA